jgi:transposase
MNTPDHETEEEAAADAGSWYSIAEIARLKGVERTTIWEKVNKLEGDGLLRTRPGPGKTRLVNLVEYDLAIGETTDFSRQQAAATRAQNAAGEESGVPSAPPGYSEAQRRKLQYEAAIKQLDYGERTKQLVAVGDVKTVIEKIAGACRGAVDVLVLRADEIAAAAAKDGTPGVRTVLKDATFKLLTAISQALRNLETIGKESDASGVDVDIGTPGEEQP